MTSDAPEQVEVDDPALLIRINQLYRPGMSAVALYEATRGVWRVGDRRDGVKYALAVFDGIVREVYEVQEWYPAGTTRYSTRDRDALPLAGRWEFTGRPAPDVTRQKYVGRSVAAYFTKGQQNPLVYVNC